MEKTRSLPCPDDAASEQILGWSFRLRKGCICNVFAHTGRRSGMESLTPLVLCSSELLKLCFSFPVFLERLHSPVCKCLVIVCHVQSGKALGCLSHWAKAFWLPCAC